MTGMAMDGRGGPVSGDGRKEASQRRQIGHVDSRNQTAFIVPDPLKWNGIIQSIGRHAESLALRTHASK